MQYLFLAINLHLPHKKHEFIGYQWIMWPDLITLHHLFCYSEKPLCGLGLWSLTMHCNHHALEYTHYFLIMIQALGNTDTGCADKQEMDWATGQILVDWQWRCTSSWTETLQYCWVLLCSFSSGLGRDGYYCPGWPAPYSLCTSTPPSPVSPTPCQALSLRFPQACPPLATLNLTPLDIKSASNDQLVEYYIHSMYKIVH